MINNSSDFYELNDRFSGLSQPDQITRIAWYLHSIKKLSRLAPKDITSFYAELHLSAPNVSASFKRLFERKPKVFLWDKGGYYLEGNCRRSLDDKFYPKDEPVRQITSQALHGLSDLIKDPDQRSFLAEAMSCYRAGAFRATIVMAWNLAYHHLTRWIINDKLSLESFNNSLATKYPKKSILVQKYDDLEHLKESEIVEIAIHAKIVSNNVGKILKEKLSRRNAAAHPSNVTFVQSQADDVVTDLVHNVISRLS